MIESFADAGGKDLGIPGSGEPFHPQNELLVRAVIETAFNRRIATTIFTTGDTLLYTNQGMIDAEYVRRPNEELIEFLIAKNVSLYIKCNSLKPEVQDVLVDLKGYAQRRNEVLDLLIEKYHLNRRKKIGIVTSIIDANANEINELCEYAKKNGLTFDCDTILPLGRGKIFNDKYGLSEKRSRKAFRELRQKQNIHTHQGGTYVGVACDRIKNHLYVDYRGNITPCLGAAGKIQLGNIRGQSLASVWDSKIRQKLRTARYAAFTQVCPRCDNFRSEECFSCLGRSIEHVIYKGSDDIEIVTKGCINHRPNFELWLDSITNYLRAMLQQRAISKSFYDGLETLWANCSCEEYNSSDLEFSMNEIWSFIPSQNSSQGNENSINESFRNILSDVTIPSMKYIFNQISDSRRIAIRICFNDAISEKSFVRVFTNQEKVGENSAKSKVCGNGIDFDDWRTIQDSFFEESDSLFNDDTSNEMRYHWKIRLRSNNAGQSQSRERLFGSHLTVSSDDQLHQDVKGNIVRLFGCIILPFNEMKSQ
ncbi:MAG: SPASM domain-containing protein [Elusimicrobia bacterium]|nr:SPASM domain-containing protein [Elusimicrobiota bacterium]